MKITLGSNTASLMAQRSLKESSNALSKVFGRLSSGMRINQASDDAAGLAISESLKTDSRVYTQAIRNINDAISALSLAEGSLEALTTITVRQRELATQAANDSFSWEQRKAMHEEFNALVNEYNRITESVEFNGTKLLEDPEKDFRIQAGYGLECSIAFKLGEELARTAGDGTFTMTDVFGTSPSPKYGQVVDMNNDGYLDLVAANSNSPSGVNVLLGNGDGTFEANNNEACGDGSYVTVADLNGDGILDAALADSYATQGVDILIGDGNGGFSSVTHNSLGTRTAGIGAADFDGDGDIDLAVTAADTNYIRMLYNDGSGTFTEGTSFSYGSGWSGEYLTVADLNNDGAMDMLTHANGRVLAFYNEGGGNFNKVGIDTVPTGTFNLTADLNNDGLLDVIGGSGTNMNVALQNDDGTFGPTIQSVLVADTLEFDSGDFNGDGITDITAVSRTDDALQIFIGNGDGTFKESSTYSTGTDPYGVDVADFNGDGVDDIVSLNSSSHNVSMFTGNTMQQTKIAYQSLLSREDALEVMDITETTLERVTAERGAIGSIMSRLGVAANNLTSLRENYEAAASRITDADIATEAAEMARLKILQETGAAVLAQANQQPALAIQLLS